MSYAPYQCNPEQRQSILDAAHAAGACAAGFAAVKPVDSNALAAYSQWIAQGKHAGMAYLEKYDDIRSNPTLLLDGAKSILCLAFAYRNTSTPRHPLFADYALGQDYHDAIRRHLEPLAELMRTMVESSQTRICIDTAPIRERYWAAKAGLGIIGLNNQLIIPKIGSAVFLAEILWTATAKPSHSKLGESCLLCGKCLKACPSGALNGINALDANRCLSYLPIEHRGDLPEEMSLLNRRIFGCDICRDACPLAVPTTEVPVINEFKPTPELMHLNLKSIAAMTSEDFNRIFRQSAVRRTKLTGLHRNAQAASTNK